METRKLNKYPIRLPKTKNPITTPPDEINLHAIVISCGKRGSGKSVSVFSKLKDLKEQNLADRVYLISPTKHSNYHLAKGLVADEDMYEEMDNSSVDNILAKIEVDAREYEEYLENTELYKLWKKLATSKSVNVDDIDPELLIKLEERGILEMDRPPKWKYHNEPGIFHLVLDDCQSSALFRPGKNNKFLNMLIRHRHVSSRPHFKVGVSLWILCQNYCAQGGLPKSVRENCTQLCMFPVKQRDIIEKVADEMGGEVHKDDFLQAYDYATKDDPHSFLLVDFNPKDKSKVFRKRWDEYIVFSARPLSAVPSAHHRVKGLGGEASASVSQR